MSIRLIAGDCRDVLPTLAADSVQCVVTSPPYYGLRDYGTALWDGGNAACNHQQLVGQRQDVGREHVDGFHGSAVVSELKTRQYRDTCGKCGARRIVAYTEMAMERCRADAPLFVDMHPPPAEDPEDERMRDLFAEAE